MARAGVVAALWAAFAFVTWNVMFDRHIYVAAVEYTRDQVLRSQNDAPLISIHDGFSPRVGAAARQATLWVLPILGVGALMTFLSFRRLR
jgi:hypothetical protein